MSHINTRVIIHTEAVFEMGDLTVHLATCFRCGCFRRGAIRSKEALCWHRSPQAAFYESPFFLPIYMVREKFLALALHPTPKCIYPKFISHLAN